jgi:hypothetical protein
MRPALLLMPALLGALAGCGTMEEAGPPPATQVAQTTVPGGKFVAFVGPQRQFAPPFLGVSDTNIDLLRSWIDRRTGEEVNQLYVEDSYVGAERNYDAARDATGQGLRFVPISRNEIVCGHGCSYAEEFAAALPTALLAAHGQGLTVIFTAKSGPPLTIEVPGELVQKQLTAVAAARATLPTAAAAPLPPTPAP